MPTRFEGLGLMKFRAEVEVREVSMDGALDRTTARELEANAKKQRKQERKAQRLMDAPSKAPLDSQESCCVC